MAILTASTYYTLRGETLTGDDATACTSWCAAVSAAIARVIRPFSAEAVTQSNIVLDAPISRDLFLPIVPVRSVTSVYLDLGANGLVANFGSDDLLDNTDNGEYQLLIDDWVGGFSRSGILRRVNSYWGSGRYRYPDRLADSLEGVRGAVLVNYLAGTTSVPPEIEAAAVLAVSLLLARKRTGAPVSSESWNGYSASLAGPFTAAGVVQTPDIAGLLLPYQTAHVG